MARVWALAGGFFLIMLILLLGFDFFGETSLKFGAVSVGTGIAVAYLPGGVALSRGIYLFVGVLLGALGFLAGSLAFADDPRGIFMGGLVLLLLSAIIAMWSRKQEVFITLMLGAGALTAAFTTTFFADPQGITYQLPITLGAVMAPLGLGYLMGAVLNTFFPSKPKEATNEAPPEPVEDAPSESNELIPMS